MVDCWNSRATIASAWVNLPGQVARTAGPQDDGHPPGKENDTMNATLAPSLSAADRCDRCGARAYIRARLHSGGELFFCGHHGRKHLPALAHAAADIHDESGTLTASPEPDAR